MYRRILGFHRRVWCPKCTPAPSNCRIVTTAMHLLQSVVLPRAQHPLGGRPWNALGCVLLWCGPHRTAGHAETTRSPPLLRPAGGSTGPGSGPGVRPSVHAEQPLLAHVGVHLGGPETGVA